MQAAIQTTYGPPDVVRVADIPEPIPRENELLIRVCAAAVNPVDWHGVRGKPYVMRLLGGLAKPKNARLGCDLAGRVEAVGPSVRHFKPGDEVFGGRIGAGAFAEYTCLPELAVVAKPGNVTFEQAAAAPVAAFTALQGLRDTAHVKSGSRVLINGAAGGVGTFAVQLAKWMGAYVVGVCSTRNLERVRSLGADRVLDYSREEFTEDADRYDAILDCVGNRSLRALRGVLTRAGVCIVITGPDGPWLGPLARFIHALLSSGLASQRVAPFIARPNPQDLTLIRDLMASGKIRPMIDRRYPLSQVGDAIRYVEEGHARGKVVVTMSEGGAQETMTESRPV